MTKAMRWGWVGLVLIGTTILPSARAQDAANESACAKLLPEVQKLESMLAAEARARSTTDESQRMQVVLSLLTLRYHTIEALESSARTSDTEEDELRSAVARGQAQLEALDEAARSAPESASDPSRKAERAQIEAVLKGLDERIKSLLARRSVYQGQLALEHHDIDKLEAILRAWLEKGP